MRLIFFILLLTSCLAYAATTASFHSPDAKLIDKSFVHRDFGNLLVSTRCIAIGLDQTNVTDYIVDLTNELAFYSAATGASGTGKTSVAAGGDSTTGSGSSQSKGDRSSARPGDSSETEGGQSGTEDPTRCPPDTGCSLQDAGGRRHCDVQGCLNHGGQCRGDGHGHCEGQFLEQPACDGCICLPDRPRPKPAHCAFRDVGSSSLHCDIAGCQDSGGICQDVNGHCEGLNLGSACDSCICADTNAH